MAPAVFEAIGVFAALLYFSLFVAISLVFFGEKAGKKWAALWAVGLAITVLAAFGLGATT